MYRIMQLLLHTHLDVKMPYRLEDKSLNFSVCKVGQKVHLHVVGDTTIRDGNILKQINRSV